ncbi:hypothetical protein ABIC85_003168 [Oerskovia enterophila]
MLPVSGRTSVSGDTPMVRDIASQVKRRGISSDQGVPPGVRTPPGDGSPGQAWAGPAMFTSQLTPNPSTHMPNASPHGATSSGTVTLPLDDSLSQ